MEPTIPFLAVPPSQQLIVPNRADRRRSGIVRNVATGRVLPCCWEDCERIANNAHRIEVPHPQPRWRDPLTGRQEMLVYTFCGQAHKALYLRNSPWADRA